jgi:hypothetical protein
MKTHTTGGIDSSESIDDEETAMADPQEHSRDTKKGKRKEPPPDPSQLSLDIFSFSVPCSVGKQRPVLLLKGDRRVSMDHLLFFPEFFPFFENMPTIRVSKY